MKVLGNELNTAASSVFSEMVGREVETVLSSSDHDQKRDVLLFAEREEDM